MFHTLYIYTGTLPLADYKVTLTLNQLFLTFHTCELMLQSRANDKILPSNIISYSKLSSLLTVPLLIPQQIDSKDKLLSHPKNLGVIVLLRSEMGVHTSSSTSWSFYVPDVVLNHTQPSFMPPLIDTHDNCTVNFGDYWHAHERSSPGFGDWMRLDGAAILGCNCCNNDMQRRGVRCGRHWMTVSSFCAVT